MKKNKKIIIAMIVILLMLAILGGVAVKKLRGHGYFSAAKNYIHFIMNKPDFDSYRPLIEKDNQWYSSEKLIAHAMGGIEETDYTNSKEALERAIENGYKIIEVDFSVTSDGKVVCAHDFSEFEVVPDYDTFMSTKIAERYSAVDIEQLVNYMVSNPDIYIMTDFKWDNSFGSNSNDVQVIMDTMTQCLTDVNDNLCDRIIVQVYNEDNYLYISQNYPYTNYVYTLYNYAYPIYEEILATCLKYQIPVVTMHMDRATKEHVQLFDTWNIKVLSHTVNDIVKAEEQFDNGVSGIYTDWILYSEMEK